MAKFMILSAILANAYSTSSLVEQCKLSKDENQLNCFLRTLGSEIQDSSVSSVNSLFVRCSDSFFFESQIKQGHFGRLPELQELHVSFCKIRHLPPRSFQGLDNLKKLSVESHNSEWTSVLMDMDVNAFQGLSGLEQLKLSYNNLWSLPINSLCTLPNLQTLNVSGNHLLDVVDLGLSFQDGCELKSLSILDMSSNFIASLRAFDLVQAKFIKTLNLSNNRLSILDDKALSNLRDLEELDMSNNQLAALPPQIFLNSTNLQKLSLQNNSLTLLTSELFDNLERLTVLNLSMNAISSHLLSEETFSGLKNLQVLDLSYNRITKINRFIFKSMTRLQVINLGHNQIHVVAEDSFQGLVNLKFLILSFNKIQRLESQVIADQVNLTSLSVDNNEIEELDLEFGASKSIQDLALNSNKLRKIPDLVKGCERLSTLDLGDNNIDHISNEDFQGLAKLYGLRLAGNAIREIANDTFNNLENVHVLNLAENELETIGTESFKHLQELRVLRLDNNRLVDINGIVSSLGKLEWLNVSSNSLEWFDYAFVPSSLQWLDMSHNQVGELGNFYNLKNFAIQTLDASNNLITRIDDKSFPSSLKHIILNQNLIHFVGPNTFAQLKTLENVQLQNNYLESLDRGSLSTSFVASPGKILKASFFLNRLSNIQCFTGSKTSARIYLSGNPFVCDCLLGWIQSINGIKSGQESRHIRRHHYHMLVQDLDELTCTLPSANGVKDIPPSHLIKNVDQDQFLCPYKTHCFDLCMCCDFYACDCRMQCPHGCECSHDASWSRNVISCSAKNHTSVPLLIPMDATHVHLDGNNLGHVDQQNFLGRHRVRHLFLNNSRVRSLSNNTFAGLVGLKTLHLENNNLERLQGHEFSTLTYLEELYLNNNELIHINEMTFSTLRSLRILRLDQNLLTSFPVWNLASDNRALTSLFLSGNMWTCECSFVTIFNDFLEVHLSQVVDYDMVQCVSSNDITVDGENCLSSAAAGSKDEFPDKEQEVKLPEVIVPAVIAIVAITLGLIVVCVFRQPIKDWLYAKSSSIYDSTTNQTPSIASVTSSNQKLFDVYVTYSDDDAEFVDATLSPTLEHSPGTGASSRSYRVCLQKRDFPTDTPVHEGVAVASESSSRVLMVLTRSYIRKEWPQLRTSFRGLVTSSSKLIILFLEDVSEAELDQDLLSYVRTCPSVRWGSPGFLNKLKFFLPESAFTTFQRNITLRTMRPDRSQTLGPRDPLYHEHMYHSIPDPANHIYQPLGPSIRTLKHPGPPTSSPDVAAARAVFLNRNLDLVLKVDPPRNSLSPVRQQFHHQMPSVSHSYSQSTSSGTQLLPPSASPLQGVKLDEYIV